MGGTKHEYLNDLTYEIWEWCEQRNLWLFVSFLPRIMRETRLHVSIISIQNGNYLSLPFKKLFPNSTNQKLIFLLPILIINVKNTVPGTDIP